MWSQSRRIRGHRQRGHRQRMPRPLKLPPRLLKELELPLPLPLPLPLLAPPVPLAVCGRAAVEPSSNAPLHLCLHQYLVQVGELPLGLDQPSVSAPLTPLTRTKGRTRRAGKRTATLRNGGVNRAMLPVLLLQPPRLHKELPLPLPPAHPQLQLLLHLLPGEGWLWSQSLRGRTTTLRNGCLNPTGAIRTSQSSRR